MPCTPFRSADGTVFGFACTRGTTPHYCACGRRAEYQCDYPLTGAKTGQTCDKWICGVCRRSQGHDRDYCPAHARVAEGNGGQP